MKNRSLFPDVFGIWINFKGDLDKIRFYYIDKELIKLNHIANIICTVRENVLILQLYGNATIYEYNHPKPLTVVRDDHTHTDTLNKYNSNTLHTSVGNRPEFHIRSSVFVNRLSIAS